MSDWIINNRRWIKNKMTPKEIYEKIGDLQQQLKEANAKVEEEKIKEIQELKWIKDVEFYFREGINPYGGKEYQLVLLEVPEIFKSLLLSKHITLLGNDNFIYNNVILANEWMRADPSSWQIRCSKASVLADFIQEYGLKIKNDEKYKEEIRLLKLVAGNYCECV